MRTLPAPCLTAKNQNENYGKMSCILQVDRYLSASGYLSSSVRPFFVALPKVCQSYWTALMCNARYDDFL